MAFFGEPAFFRPKSVAALRHPLEPSPRAFAHQGNGTQQKSIISFLGPFLIARKRFEEMRMSSVLFFAFVCVILIDFEIIDQSGGKSSTMRPNATGHFNPKFHVNLSFFRQKFKVAIHSGVIKLSFFFVGKMHG